MALRNAILVSGTLQIRRSHITELNHRKTKNRWRRADRSRGEAHEHYTTKGPTSLRIRRRRCSPAGRRSGRTSATETIGDRGQKVRYTDVPPIPRRGARPCRGHSMWVRRCGVPQRQWGSRWRFVRVNGRGQGWGQWSHKERSSPGVRETWRRCGPGPRQVPFHGTIHNWHIGCHGRGATVRHEFLLAWSPSHALLQCPVNDRGSAQKSLTSPERLAAVRLSWRGQKMPLMPQLDESRAPPDVQGN